MLLEAKGTGSTPNPIDTRKTKNRRFDLNNDGFLSQDEFRQVNMNNTW